MIVRNLGRLERTAMFNFWLQNRTTLMSSNVLNLVGVISQSYLHQWRARHSTHKSETQKKYFNRFIESG